MIRLLSRLFLCFLLVHFAVSLVKEAPDGSVCFNNCNEHGDCVDYSCHCWPGYHGDDCGSTFVSDGERVVPILSAGHYNLTRKNFTSAVIKNKLMLVGFSAYSCHRCIAVESEYEKLTEALTLLGVTFARADVNQMKSIALEHEASELPALVLFQKNRPLPFRGAHTSEAVLAFVEKQMTKPTRTLKTVEEVEAFLASRNNSCYTTSTIMVVGFFSDHGSIEEDDYDDFIEVAKDLQVKEDVYFAVATDPKVCEWFKKNKTIDRTPSVLIMGDNGMKSINLDELFGEKFGLKEWISKNAIPLVGKMTNSNFKLYEKIPNPMLLLFLDLTHEHSSAEPGRVVGGKSGKILNENLLDEFRHVAKEHSEKITFVYLDGLLHEDRMKTLGLFGGKERLPSLAFNTREGLQIPFPEELPINRDTLLQFCADFISGKLKSVFDTTEMAKKVMQSVKPINQKNKAQRKDRKKAPKHVQGVSEQYDDGSNGDRAIVSVTLKNFEEVVMDDGKDVMLMLHAKGSEACSHFSVYYKHMANRFSELQIESLVIARMDISDESPPPHMGLVVGNLPLVIMLPAGGKHAPWTYYSGVGKVGPLMKWAQEHASTPFKLPNMPHLNDAQSVLYKEQVREREEHLESKRREDARAMATEDRAQKEVKRKKKNEKKREAAAAAAAAGDSAGVLGGASTLEIGDIGGLVSPSVTSSPGNAETGMDATTVTSKGLSQEEEEEEVQPLSRLAKRREEKLKADRLRAAADEEEEASGLRRKRGSNVYSKHEADNDEF